MSDTGLTSDQCRNLSISDAVSLLQLEGSQITEEEIRANIAAGAPVNSDGTLDLAAYGAWLIEDAKTKRLSL